MAGKDVVDGNDSDSELSVLADFLGLQVNAAHQKYQKIFIMENIKRIFSGTIGGTSVPAKPDTNPDVELNVEDVVNLLKLDEEALEFGRQACLDNHNNKRDRHKFTKPLTV